jgi:hypothetical protein
MGEIIMQSGITDTLGSKHQIFGATHVKGFRLVLNNTDRWRGDGDELDDPIETLGASYEELIANIAPKFKEKMDKNETLKNKYYTFIGDEIDIYPINYIIFGDKIFIDESSEEDALDIKLTHEKVHADIKNYLAKYK